jgi:hypothetical protein
MLNSTIAKISMAAAGAAVMALSAGGAAQATVIDFETLPDGTTTPTDNADLTSSYTVDGITTTFGFDIDGDLAFDANAVFESRKPGTGGGFAYIDKGFQDVDRTTTNEGGDWLLRSPNQLNLFDNVPNRTAADFIVQYTGTPVRSASGQLWDIDGGETFSIEALDSAGALISSITTPSVPNNEGPNTFSGLPYNFSFSNLGSDIGFIRISGISRIGGRAIGFDNFEAAGSSVNPEPTSVPEPASLLGLLAVGAFGAGSALKRKQKA